MHNLLTLVQLLEHYDGASLLRLHNIAKTKGDDDIFRLLQDDCQHIVASNGQIELTFTEFVRFQSLLDKKLEKDKPQNEHILGRNTKSSAICSLL